MLQQAQKLCSLDSFVESSPVDLEAEILTILQPSGISTEVERTPSMRYELSLIMLGLPWTLVALECSMSVAFGFEWTRLCSHKKFRRYKLMAVLQRDIKCCHVRQSMSLATKFSSLLQEGPTAFSTCFIASFWYASLLTVFCVF